MQNPHYLNYTYLIILIICIVLQLVLLYLGWKVLPPCSSWRVSWLLCWMLSSAVHEPCLSVRIQEWGPAWGSPCGLTLKGEWKIDIKCFAETRQEFYLGKWAGDVPTALPMDRSSGQLDKQRSVLVWASPGMLVEVTHPETSSCQDVPHLTWHICSQNLPFSPCTGLLSSRNIKVGLRFFLRGSSYMGNWAWGQRCLYLSRSLPLQTDFWVKFMVGVRAVKKRKLIRP